MMFTDKEKVAIIAVKRPREEIDIEELKGLVEALGGEVVQTVSRKGGLFHPQPI